MSPIMVNVSLTESLTSISYLSGQNKQHYITCNVNLLCVKQKLPDHSKITARTPEENQFIFGQTNANRFDF